MLHEGHMQASLMGSSSSLTKLEAKVVLRSYVPFSPFGGVAKGSIGSPCPCEYCGVTDILVTLMGTRYYGTRIKATDFVLGNQMVNLRSYLSPDGVNLKALAPQGLDGQELPGIYSYTRVLEGFCPDESKKLPFWQSSVFPILKECATDDW